MQTVVILGTGGTIAGTNDDPARAWHYQAAQLSISQLVEAVPELAGLPIETLEVARIDSKDMRWSVWQTLGHALKRQLARDDVAGVVITHGTDTLEETAYLLHRIADCGGKPVVLTAAMRPATAPDADGPANLRDAVRAVLEAARRGLGGVVAVMHGRVWHGGQVRKAWSNIVDAFDGGGQAPLVTVDASGRWPNDDGATDSLASRWPSTVEAVGWDVLDQPPPRVEILVSHADADGWLLDAALLHGSEQDRLAGLVVAGTGHGTIHDALEAALRRRAAAAGVTVWRSSRVARGGVEARAGDDAEWPACAALTPAQARIALMLHLLSQKQRPDSLAAGDAASME